MVTQNNTFLLEIPSMIYQEMRVWVYIERDAALCTMVGDRWHGKNNENGHIGQSHAQRLVREVCRRTSEKEREGERNVHGQRPLHFKYVSTINCEMEPYWLPRISSLIIYKNTFGGMRCCYVYECALTSVYLVSISRFILFSLFFSDSISFVVVFVCVCVYRLFIALLAGPPSVDHRWFSLRFACDRVCSCMRVCVRVDVCQRFGGAKRAYRNSDGIRNRCRAQLDTVAFFFVRLSIP